MSLKCSLFGCAYGDREIHREREEDGSEVVITIRETETCSRCGDVRVVSENKEVTTLETAADIVADDLDEESQADRSPASGGGMQSPDPGSDPEREPESRPEPATGESTTDDGSTVVPDAETDEVVTAGSDDPTATETPSPPAVEDDGVILDESDDDRAGADGDRSPSEWPEEPEHGDGDREPDSSAGNGYESVEWPGESEHSDEDPDPDGPSGDAAGRQPIDDGPGFDEVDPFGSSSNTVSVPEGEFYCPECGYATPVESSSLRVGDYCPECHRGDLEQRTE